MQPGLASEAQAAPDHVAIEAGDAPLSRLTLAERVNFLITNRIPRRWLTLFVGRISAIRSPLFARIAIGVWQLFVDDLRLHEAEKQQFSSIRECFTRKLRAEARPVDTSAGVITSPCDAVVGEFGIVRRQQVLQAKGYPYGLSELLGNCALAADLEGARYVTLRLKSSMYHRFHAPCDATTQKITYISGDTWNVNPVALKVVERLFCRNERAVLELFPENTAERVVLVPVAAILVASMRFRGVEGALDLKYRGPNEIPFHRRVRRGQELGYFEHGSTIVMFVSGSLQFAPAVRSGRMVRMGEALLRESEKQPRTPDYHKPAEAHPSISPTSEA